MSHLWDQTINIDAKLATQLIVQQNLLAVQTIKLLGEGYDNVAYLINDEYVFRFPRREMGIDCIENEILLLPYIRSKVNFQLTSPEFIGKPSPTYNAPFAGYKKIKGHSLSETPAKLIDDKNFATTLASWLKQLHSIKVVDEHIANIKGDQSWRTNIKNRIEISRDRIEKYEAYFVASGFNITHLKDLLNRFSDFEISSDYKNPTYMGTYIRVISSSTIIFSQLV